jgi:hypothetical protein
VLGFAESPLPVALSGGILLASVGYRQRVQALLESLGLRPDPVTVVREPTMGALRLALLSQQSST